MAGVSAVLFLVVAGRGFQRTVKLPRVLQPLTVGVLYLLYFVAQLLLKLSDIFSQMILSTLGCVLAALSVCLATVRLDAIVKTDQPCQVGRRSGDTQVKLRHILTFGHKGGGCQPACRGGSCTRHSYRRARLCHPNQHPPGKHVVPRIGLPCPLLKHYTVTQDPETTPVPCLWVLAPILVLCASIGVVAALGVAFQEYVLSRQS